MKLLFTLFFSITFVTYSQSEDKKVKEIRSWYSDVESRLSQCIRVPITMFYDKDYVNGGSTEIEGFYDTINKEFIKIVEVTYYDWSEDVVSYYFHEGNLFFIFQEGSHAGQLYTADELDVTEQELWESGGEAKTMIFYENRYYYAEEACIRHLQKSIEVAVEETPDLKEIKNKKAKTDDEITADLRKHGMKLYFHLSPKK